MPNNETRSRLIDDLVFSDPLNIRPIPANAESVLSRYHPANSRRESEGRRTYTFRQRVQKLDLTLGWELEANHAPTRIPNGVEHIGDGSVNGEGAEMVVLPAVTKSPRYVLGLLKDVVHAPKLNTDESCGFHVHVSASNIASLARMRQWAMATEHLALQIEDLAFRAVPDSRKGNTYCKRIIPLENGTRFEVSKYNNSRRYHWLNIVEMFRPNGIRTIENRLLGHTHRWKYVLAWTLFTMELGRRGWELSNKPFDITGHVSALSDMLLKIAKEIKPLDKRTEPIPQWVYNGLATFGIESNAWERPLARLSETESDLRGMPKMFYSDNQIEMPNRNEDEESEECPCGCGNEGRCQSQEHEDGDCESNYCEYCHEDGRCDGVPDCERCIMTAHDNGEDCQRSGCRTCRPAPRAVPVSDPLNVNGVTTGRVTARDVGIDPRPITGPSNVTIHASNGTVPPEGYSYNPLTATTFRRAVEHLRGREGNI